MTCVSQCLLEINLSIADWMFYDELDMGPPQPYRGPDWARGLWVLDVANAMPGLGNGFWDLSSEKGFHVGLWSAIAAFVFVALTDRAP